MYCPNCRTPLGEDAAFCPNCGMNLSAHQAQNQTKTPPAQSAQPQPVQGQVTVEKKLDFSRAKKWLIPLILLLVLGIAAGITIPLVLKSEDEKHMTDILDQEVAMINERSLETSDWMKLAYPLMTDEGCELLTKAVDMANQKDGGNLVDEPAGDYYEKMTNEFGNDFRLSYDLLEKQKMTTSELEEAQNELSLIADYMDIDELEDDLKSGFENLDSFTAQERSEAIKEIAEYTGLSEAEINRFLNEVKNSNGDLEERLGIVDSRQAKLGYHVKLRVCASGSKDSARETLDGYLVKFGEKWILLDEDFNQCSLIYAVL